MLDSLIDPVGETTDSRDKYYQRNRRQALPPGRICKSAMMLVVHLAQKKLAYHSQYIYRGNND